MICTSQPDLRPCGKKLCVIKGLTAQQTLLQSRLTLASDRFDLVQGEINLFKALGGGIGSK